MAGQDNPSQWQASGPYATVNTDNNIEYDQSEWIKISCRSSGECVEQANDMMQSEAVLEWGVTHPDSLQLCMLTQHISI